MKVNKIVFGLMAGITVGTILSVILTSRKGANARRKMFHSSKQYFDLLKDKFKQTMDRQTNEFDDLFEDSLHRVKGKLPLILKREKADGMVEID